jgi:uncharacterized membrane-anchored protein YhcB (DUF1043 family)
MRAMWLGFAVAIVIAIVAGYVVAQMGETSAQRYSTASTRL